MAKKLSVHASAFAADVACRMLKIALPLTFFGGLRRCQPLMLSSQPTGGVKGGGGGEDGREVLYLASVDQL